MLRTALPRALVLAAIAAFAVPANAGIVYSYHGFEINEGGRQLYATLVTDLPAAQTNQALSGHLVSWDFRIVNSQGGIVDEFTPFNSVMVNNTFNVDAGSPDLLLHNFPVGSINVQHFDSPPYNHDYSVGINVDGLSSNTEAPDVGGFRQYDQQLYGGSWTAGATSVPEPSSFAMLGIGAPLLAYARRKRTTKAA